MTFKNAVLAGGDSESARRFLFRRLGSGVEMGDALPHGEWSRAYAFRHSGRDLVVRFNPSREAFDIDVLAMRFASAALPIPTVIEVGDVDGGFYAVSERAHGKFLEEFEPQEMRAALASVMATLDALQTADSSASRGFGPWGQPETPATTFGAIISSTWRARRRRTTETAGVRTWPGPSWPSERFARGWAASGNSRGNAPSRGALSTRINRNAFVSDGRITALIDWQCAMYGDHLYDLAWFTFLWFGSEADSPFK